MKLSSPSAMRIPQAIRLFLWVSFALWALCFAVELLCRSVLHYKTPEFRQPFYVGLHFYDLYCYGPCFRYLHTARFFSHEFPFPYGYPAAVAPIYKFFYAFPGEGIYSFAPIVCTGILIVGLMLARALYLRGMNARNACLTVALTIFMSYPILFAGERANMELIIFFPIAGGAWAFLRNRPYAAAFLWALAACMKLYPIIFLGMLLSRKEYRATAFGVVSAVLLTVASLWWLGPTIPIAFHGVQAGQALFREAFLLRGRPDEFGYDHSLFGLWRRFAVLPAPEVVARILTGYMACAAIGGTLLYIFRIRFLPVFNQMLALVVASVLLTPVSFDYTLIQLYTPLAILFLLIADRAKAGLSMKVPGLAAIVVCLALLCSAESELIWHAVRAGSAFKCLVLVALFLLAMIYRIGPPIDTQDVPLV